MMLQKWFKIHIWSFYSLANKSCFPPIHAPNLLVIFHNWKRKAFYWSSLSTWEQKKIPTPSHGPNSNSSVFYPLHSSYAGLPSVSNICWALRVFDLAASSAWNTLPPELGMVGTILSFRYQLRCHLLREVFPEPSPRLSHRSLLISFTAHCRL